MKVSDFVKDNTLAYFHYYREGYLYYNITIFVYAGGDKGEKTPKEIQYWMFPIPIEDTKGATFNSVHKALELMRWVRTAIEDGTMVRHYPRQVTVN